MRHARNRFDIPTADPASAQPIYEAVLGRGMGFFAHIVDRDGNPVGLHALA